MTRLVIKIVGAVLGLSLAGIVLLAAIDRPVPDVLPMVSTGALTGLVGLLVPRTPE